MICDLSVRKLDGDREDNCLEMVVRRKGKIK